MLLENPPPHNFSNGPSLKESNPPPGEGGQKRYFIRGSMCVLAKIVKLRP